MKKILITGFATLMTAAVAASTVPAQAGGHHNNHGHHHNHGNHNRHFGFYDSWDSSRYSYRDTRFRHIDWCQRHHRRYDPRTNTFFSQGRWFVCDSPFI